jgi:CheY-like chemotaxis protein
MKSNRIILIDDDEEDCELFITACAELNIPNEVLVFNESKKAFDYLLSMTTQPFFIICDVNMPVIDGLELRKKINENNELRPRAIPFLFWSTSGSGNLINKAYALNIQGFFIKPSTMKGIKEIITAVTLYWDCSYHPIR